MNKINTKEFFNTISNGQKLNFEYIYEQGKSVGNFPHKSKMKYYSKAAISEFKEWNSKGYGIYFVPNGGGYKDTEIAEYRSCFSDLDIKDEIMHEIISSGFKGENDELKKLVTDKFQCISDVERLKYKQIFMDRVNALKHNGIPPSAITETKNGFHAYYFLNTGTQKEQFETIEGLLIYCLNGDLAVKNPARLLRVPETQHLKNPSDPYTIEIKEWNPERRYDPDSLITALSDLQDHKEQKSLLFVNPLKKPLYKSKLIPKIGGLPSRKGIDYSSFRLGNISLISKGFEGLNELKMRLDLNHQEDLCYIDRSDIRQYLKRQNLMDFLGLESKRFFCLFHQSSNPSSGSIYVHEDKYFYKCHSSSCGVHYDIIQIVERLTGLPVHKAFDYLKQIYNIAENKIDWQIEQEQLIDINLDIIERFRYDVELRQSYPYLTKFLDTKGTMGLLIQIHELARRKLPQLSKVADMNNAIVFAPMNMVVNEILNNTGSGLNNIDNANTKAVIMIFMYILNCIGLDQLPDELQRKAKEFQEKDKERNGKVALYKHLARYYEIVSLDTDRLILAEEMAEFFYQRHMTLSGFNREQLIRLCGSEEADRVFPDRIDEEVSDINKSITQEVQTLVTYFIEAKGWTNDSEIAENLVIPNFDIKQGFKDTFKYIKRKESEAIDSMHIKDNDSKMLKWYRNFIMKKLRINMPGITYHSGLKKSRINKELRRVLDIPENINGYVYHTDQIIGQDIDTIHIEDKATHIKRLKAEDSSLSNSKIASIVKCSRQYVSNVLKSS